MIKLKQLLLRLLFITVATIVSSASANISQPAKPFPLQIVAAENFYGQIAQQIGGKYVAVTSILNNPNQDPHLFSNSPSTATMVANAQVIIYNGLGYDSWIEHLISVNPKNKTIINVAELIDRKIGDNPHIWYQPQTMLVYATFLAGELTKLLPEHAHYFQQQLLNFKQHYELLNRQIAQLKKQYQGTPVIATEPVFNYLAEILGFKIYGRDYQLSIMNETEPTATQIKDFEEKLRQHQVKLLIYNNQVSNPSTQRMRKLAEQYGIPTIGVHETKPPNKSYLNWIMLELSRLQHTLEKGGEAYSRQKSLPN